MEVHLSQDTKTAGEGGPAPFDPQTGNGPRITDLEGCGSPVVKVSIHGRHVMNSSLVPLKIRRVEEQCTLYLSRAETSSRWCGVVVRRGGASSVVLITRPWFKMTWSVAKSPRVAEQGDVNIHSLSGTRNSEHPGHEFKNLTITRS
ncbi:uncharacterized protein TNCV_4738171 [Trichonephila clavipes]|nr:uncharacterized protein TNCV_4738171 [Trichonephila clavipes]